MKFSNQSRLLKITLFLSALTTLNSCGQTRRSQQRMSSKLAVESSSSAANIYAANIPVGTIVHLKDELSMPAHVSSLIISEKPWSLTDYYSLRTDFLFYPSERERILTTDKTLTVTKVSSGIQRIINNKPHDEYSGILDSHWVFLEMKTTGDFTMIALMRFTLIASNEKKDNLIPAAEFEKFFTFTFPSPDEIQ